MTEIELLTPQEYAEYRRCAVRTLDRERAEGRGCPYVRLGARILYRRADIDRYMEAHVRGGDITPPRRRGRPPKPPASAAPTPKLTHNLRAERV